LIIWGREDRIVPAECAQMFHDAIPNSQLKFIDRCGHYPYFEQPGEFNRIVSDFLLKD
jgi:2-hydroxy-6-oxonona-2,4-dienedioate hydrolase